MRQNLPITQREHALDPALTLVSVTDPQGVITYANVAFVQASGYDVGELMGQPHNLVRHPDVPPEAFRDLWSTIQSGQPWQGIVKNRRKNGDHYWVEANVTPMRDGARTVGYLSVRRIPTRAQVQAAEALYAKLKGEASRTRPRVGLSGGRVVRRDLPGRLVQGARRQVPRWGWDGAAALGAVIVTAWAATAWPLAALLPLAVATSAFAWWVSHRRRESALRQVLDDTLALAAGDLTRRPGAGAGDTLGQIQLALNQLAVNLRASIADVRTELLHLRGVAAEIAAGNQDLSARTESQAGSLEQTAASMEQITGTVRNTSERAAEGGRMATSTSEVARQSREAVQAAVDAMAGISDSGRRIGDIIQVIEGVAFQTNILALNAAVEAARAGETGRGFAVVASEVRALSGRTSEAARQIRRLITETIERVDVGAQQTGAAQQAMEKALTAVGQVGSLLAGIDQATREQALGVSQVNEAVAHMDGVTQQNAAMVEQLAAAAKGLNDQVDHVTHTMRLFRVNTSDRTMAERDAAELRPDAKAAPAQVQGSAKPASGPGAPSTRRRTGAGQALTLDSARHRSEPQAAAVDQWAAF